jgi:hypothetical protein
VNRLVSSKRPVFSRLFGLHAAANSLKTYPGALNTGAAAIEKSDPTGSLFSYHRHLPLPHQMMPSTLLPPGQAIAAAPSARTEADAVDGGNPPV